MRNIIRISAGTAAVLLAAGTVVFTASAAQAADDTTGANASVNGGVLSISAPTAVTFPLANPGTTSEAAAEGIAVTDTRAGTVGWAASVSTTDFVSVADPTRSIGAGALGYTPATAVETGTLTLVKSDTITGSTAGSAVQTASGVTGNNSATWSAALTLTVPSDALAATDYQATVTHSVL
ncbi:hypothetical protein [Curtobacterium sp. VKM Ac-1376]|uniref:hypothetical protein n=1 Tax=Curtobacterium sp. VKM Ac-1376 TaxID=123312 RepID=UPI00188AA3A7|nr:hypothetical protein [Curtobacterium sp. VKM Ac-1376]MBF4615949.1 hypothetical protein [Curtobacterium sp. VKM Ac-1376]